MKINVIGGGPAGLYFALLMKRADAAHEIHLFERNAPNDTFGWGVVFSGQTLSRLQTADAESHAAITARFATWDNVDVVYRGQKISIHGNSFAGIARLELLHILQARCRELGVALHFNTEIEDLEKLTDCDLLIGADGVNSAVRNHFAEHFEPDLSVRANRYIWYGTQQLFHGLTLTFRETAAGVFCAHSYKFNATTSTFIIECDPATWDAAGFENMNDADTRAYLAQQVFAYDLQGHELLSNHSKWINFVNVRNKIWHHRNIVLLGDALHTAHFSIGSGTKLALEDSIALQQSLIKNENDVPHALADFQTNRKPVIETYQAAAAESLQFFEHVKDFLHLAPYEFAYGIMMRSGKIDREKLRQRDPEFMAQYETTVG